MTEGEKEAEEGKNKELLPPKREKEIPAEIGELVEKIGEEKVKEVIAVVHEEMQLELHRGPLPHPKTFGQYEEVLPGAADRIITMAEKQQNHRMGIEKSVIDGDMKRADLGLKLGFILFLMFGLGSIVLLGFGKDIQGYTLLATSLLGGIANFIRVGRERIKQTQKEDKPILKRKKKKKKKKDKNKEEESKEASA